MSQENSALYGDKTMVVTSDLSLAMRSLPEKDSDHMHETSRLILDAAGDGIYGLDGNGCFTFVNPAARSITGWSIEELEGHNAHTAVHHSHADGSHYAREACPIYRSLKDGQVHHCENEVFWRKDGSSFPVSYTSTPIMRGGVPDGAVIVFSDITERLKQQSWEKSRSALFESILAQEPLDRTIEIVSRAFEELHPGVKLVCHVRRERTLSLLPRKTQTFLVKDGLCEISISADSCACGRAAYWGKEQVWKGECGCASLHTSHHQCLPLLSGSGEVLGTLSVFLNEALTNLASIRTATLKAAELARLAFEHDKLQQQLRHQAHHDLLTGLPNRMLLQVHLDHALSAAKRRQRHVGVCFIDLDRFKQINDTLGHAVGDEYLQIITSVLRTSCRETDTLARQGGDEFILLLRDIGSEQEAEEIVERLLCRLRETVSIDGTEFNPTASVGISIYPQHGDTPLTLLQNADTALYTAKREGRNRAALYHHEMGNDVRESAWIYSGLQQVLAKEQLRLVFQPVFSLQKELTGFEALLRWEHPTDGLIMPDRFIPTAEESGLIIPIGEWVLNEACRQAALWQSNGSAAISIAVNVSGVQLAQQQFVQQVQAVLESTRLAPELLHLEITETWVVSDPCYAAEQLRKLRSLGVKISIDDFGIGQSSFGCLHDLPLDTLKIDRSFIARMDGNLSTVSAIVLLAQQLGLRTIAEGVETTKQLEELRAIDCDLLQGFLMAKPLDPEMARDLVRQSHSPLSLGSGQHPSL